MTKLYLLSVASLILSGALGAPLAEADPDNKAQYATASVWKSSVAPTPTGIEFADDDNSFSSSRAFSGYSPSFTAYSFESKAPVNASVVSSFESKAPVYSSVAPSFVQASEAITAASASSIPGASSTGLTHTGRATYYEVGNDNCGTSSTDSDLVCAISQELYNSAANSESISTYCGKYININYGGKSVRVKVVDSCPSCGENDLDLSPTAFGDLADLDIGVLTIDWQWE